jgi:hypothetical protein
MPIRRAGPNEDARRATGRKPAWPATTALARITVSRSGGKKQAWPIRRALSTLPTLPGSDILTPVENQRLGVMGEWSVGVLKSPLLQHSITPFGITLSRTWRPNLVGIPSAAFNLRLRQTVR